MNSSIIDTVSQDFESSYTRLREQEGRMYTDEQVAGLPIIPRAHPHYREWQMRKQSSKRLVRYLQKKQATLSTTRELNLLEVGCGNGWLSRSLATVPNSKVIGIDCNSREIEQAGRIFDGVPNLNFMHTDIDTGLFDERQFDIVIFAASIQYFSPLRNTIERISQLLKPCGEVHILDSPFYSVKEVITARERSRKYFASTGFPDMSATYFHHTLDEIRHFSYSIHYDPNRWINSFLPNQNVFYWICIRP